MQAPDTIHARDQAHPTVRADTVALKDIRKRLPLRVLSAEDWRHWTTWGYVIVRDAVPAANVRRLIDVLWTFQQMDPADASTWDQAQRRDHAMTELNNTGTVEIYHHQTLWDNRQHPRVYDAFVDIWDREDLWVTIDRANLNTPNRGQRATEGSIHWDVDTSRKPLPVGVQGVLSLVDTDDVTGGMQGVPELFRTGAILGRAAVRRSFLAHDGVEPPSAMTTAVLQRFDADPVTLLDWAVSARPRDWAAFTRTVFDHAGQGAAAALELVRNSALDVERMLDRLTALGATRIALMGGVAAPTRPYLSPRFDSVIIAAGGDALDGALLLARSLVNTPSVLPT